MYSHVYLVAYPKDGQFAGMRVPLDLSHGWYPGWEHQEYWRKTEWPLGTSMSSSLLWGAAAAAGGLLLYKVFARRAN